MEKYSFKMTNENKNETIAKDCISKAVVSWDNTWVSGKQPVETKKTNKQKKATRLGAEGFAEALIEVFHLLTLLVPCPWLSNQTRQIT